MLLREHGADETDQGLPVGEDPDDIGAAADLPVEAFLGVIGPDLTPGLLRKYGEREHVGPGGLQMVRDPGQLLLQRVQDPIELGVHGIRIGLVVNTVQQGFHPGPAGLGREGHQIRRVMGSTPLPGRSGQGRADRRHEAGVGVGGHEFDPGQSTGGEVTEEAEPAGPVLAAGRLDPQDFPVPVGVDTGRDQGVDVRDPPALADFQDQGIRGDERVRAGVQRTGPERFHLFVQVPGRAMIETWDLDRRVMPRDSTSFSIRRVETPSR